MRLLREASDKAEKILTENRVQLDKLADALVESETLDLSDIEVLIGPHAHEPATPKR